MAKPMGMMSGCYFIGRAELLQLINELLGISYNQVEDVANGAAFCQVIDAVHPGTVALNRVNYNAVTEAEMVENYKILQDAFQKNGITQYVDVATLCRGKYMAALEMFQWIHGYFEQMGGPMGYDGPGRRRQTKCRDPNDRGRPAAKPAGMAKRQSAAPLKTPAAVKAAPAAKSEKPKVLRTESEPPKNAKSTKAVKVAPVPDENPLPETKKLRQRIGKLEQEVDQMAQERDFYYAKLRRIEDHCQENEAQPIVQQILDMLYEADEERGFVAPEAE
jgi:RP/EB family microtubule-associated protein